ncbi:hypothetical protein EDD18DRAFT_1105564 [Armillaria luteobubalina]|uniref:Uncharacterized protein n=1 Tax=Armillaria luteobubalina TaxID=153913 RepID=A0AA39Q568_9AGAR|nr:hypothetical protein EDD18DRAFT_1105564 [Armillaria luteobubalina]
MVGFWGRVLWSLNEIVVQRCGDCGLRVGSENGWGGLQQLLHSEGDDWRPAEGIIGFPTIENRVVRFGGNGEAYTTGGTSDRVGIGMVGRRQVTAGCLGWGGGPRCWAGRGVSAVGTVVGVYGCCWAHCVHWVGVGVSGRCMVMGLLVVLGRAENIIVGWGGDCQWWVQYWGPMGFLGHVRSIVALPINVPKGSSVGLIVGHRWRMLVPP